MRAVIVSVEYSDILSVTLPYNRHHFEEVMVVTTTGDVQTIEVSIANNARTFCTESFYERGAKFNKWLALERALDRFGRHGWIALLDADVLWPKEILGSSTDPTNQPLWLTYGCLHSPLRRMYEEPIVNCTGDGSVGTHLYVPPEPTWKNYKLHPNVQEWAGYTQVFHAEDPALGPPPWHNVDWSHAGGADSFFQLKWPADKKVRPAFEVLHIGPAGQNWCGRTTAYLGGRRPEEAEERAAEMRRIWNGRRGKAGEDRFRHEKLRPTE